MDDLQLWVPLVCSVIGMACLWASLRLRRRHRLFNDLPTSKVSGVFIGLVEVKGTAESEAPFISRLAEAPCVYHGWEVRERWSRVVTETTTDSKGNRTTRRRRKSGWTTVAHGGESAPFFVQDDTGSLLVRPAGAKLEPSTFFNRTVSRADPLYYQHGPAEAIRDSDHVRCLVEKGIRLHAPLYVVGAARERADIVAPEIAARADTEFVISTHGEDHVCRRLSGWSWFWWALGLVVVSAPFLAALDARLGNRFSPGLSLAAPLLYLAAWAAFWVWMVYNSLVGLRERVRQGRSLIDVQLKRRHDLVPQLVSAVSALGSHEADVQQAIASLRASSRTTSIRDGEELHGLTGQLRAVVENHPQLTAQPAFAALHRELVETEQRIALARSYYNDIAAQFATRLEIIPDRWVARLGAMRPEPLMEAAGFERAVVRVNLAA